MVQERVEEYLAAIYRLREEVGVLVPLSQLVAYFGFSPVSIHEMIQKLDRQEWVVYHPYRGVTLTKEGEAIAEALLRRHRLWERFLTDVLSISWDEAHTIAGELEHAAPESVTERLAAFLGDPACCPHGAPIPPSDAMLNDLPLAALECGDRGRVSRISPETQESLAWVQQQGLVPPTPVQIVEQHENETAVKLDGRVLAVPEKIAHVVWIEKE